MNKLNLAAAVGVATLFATASFSSGQILFSDSFSRTTGMGGPVNDTVGDSDWGANDNLLGGSQSATYLVGPERGGGANQVVNQEGFTIEGAAFLPLDAAASSPMGFTVGFDFDRFAGPSDGGDGNGYIAIGLGADLSLDQSALGGAAFALNNTDTAVLFQQGVDGNVGNGQVFTNDGTINMPPAFPAAFDYGDPTASHSVVLTAVPQVTGLYGDSDLVDINVTVDGNSLFDYTTNGGTDFGTFSVSSNGFVFRSIDNLVVEAIMDDVRLPGDANGDGTVSILDFAILRANFGSNMGTFETGDFNEDGLVSILDFAILRANFGTSLTPAQLATVDAWYASVVPEPTTAALLALGGLAMLRRRR